jgi:hypothetical protein
MELPIIPTDNFYKFFSIGGLVGAITCLVMGFTAFDDLIAKKFDYSLHLKKNEIELKYLERNVDAESRRQKLLKEAVGSLDKRLPNLKASSPSDKNEVREVFSEVDKGREATEKLGTKLQEMEIKSAELGIERERMLELLKRTQFIIKLTEYSSTSLFFQSVLGFVLWYFRVQRQQDHLLRGQVEALRAGKPVDP